MELPIKNYDDLRQQTLVPRLLVVFQLPTDSATWLEQSEERMISRHCAYYLSLLGRTSTENKATITMHVPKVNLFTVGSLIEMMGRVSQREPL